MMNKIFVDNGIGTYDIYLIARSNNFNSISIIPG